jgi:arylsulfatase A-like enzyme
MSAKQNFRLALKAGALTGMLLGTVDVLIRVLLWSFEWYELYLTLLTSMIILIATFLLLGVVVEFSRRKIKLLNKKLGVFYFACAAAFVFLFYSSILINMFVIKEEGFSGPTSLKVNLFLLALSALFFSVLFFRDETTSFFDFLKEKGVKGFVDNYAFFVLIFIGVCYFLDVYYQGYMPFQKSSISVDGYPNVLFIVVDTLRADHLSLYGYPVETSPKLDEFSEGAVVFDNTVSVSPWTLPSHATMFTGKYVYHHNTTDINQLINPDETLLAEVLGRAGYATAGFVSGVYCKAKYGLSQGMDYYHDRLDFFIFDHTFANFDVKTRVQAMVKTIVELTVDKENALADFLNVLASRMDDFFETVFFSDLERSSDEVNKDVFNWLERNGDQTFFLFIHYFDPHIPYTLGEEYRYLFTNDSMSDYEVENTFYSKRYSDVPQKSTDYLKAVYDAEIRFQDDSLGELFGKLEELDLMNDTLIIITADHGEEFREHGAFDHSKTLYQEVLHVPLIMRYPSSFAPGRVEQRVSLVDLYPTILDFLGVGFEGVDGVSLMPLLEGSGSVPERDLLSEYWGRPYKGRSVLRAVFADDWKLVEVNPEYSPYNLVNSSLFDLGEDPREQVNVYEVNITKKEELQGLLNDFVD